MDKGGKQFDFVVSVPDGIIRILRFFSEF
jgi:hypothetical protein